MSIFHTDDCLFQIEGTCKKCRECAYCGAYLYFTGKRYNHHFDHIKANSKGGRTRVPACSECNFSKGPKTLRSWFRWLSGKNPKLWNSIIEYNKYKRNRIAQEVRYVRDYG